MQTLPYFKRRGQRPGERRESSSPLSLLSPLFGTDRRVKSFAGRRRRAPVCGQLPGLLGLPFLMALLLGLPWPPVARASAAAPVVVVLGIHEDGRPLAGARAAVTQHLLHMGESALAPALSTQDLLCTASDCLQHLARSFHADRLLGGELLPNDRNYIVRLWMFDVAQQQPSTTEEHCTECSKEQVYELVARGAGKLLDAVPIAPAEPPTPPAVPPAVAPPQLPAVPPPVPSPPPEVAPPPQQPAVAPPSAVPVSPPPPVAVTPAAPRCAPRFYSFGRGVAAGALGGIGVASLASAIALTATDGSVYLSRADGYPSDITWNFQQQYRAVYTLSALSMLGLAAVLYDWRKLSGRSLVPTPSVQCEAPRGHARWTFKRGLAIGALGSLLVTGLISSVALTALDGGSYVSTDPTVIDTPVPYHFRTAYSVGYAASAGLLLGLGLAVFLP